MKTDQSNTYYSYPGITAEEMFLLNQATSDLDETQLRNFQNIYATKRKNSQDILLLTLLAFVGVSGIHRIVLGQAVMGILYFFTWGFFGIMNIMDIVNNKRLTDDYNRQMMSETYHIIKAGRF